MSERNPLARHAEDVTERVTDSAICNGTVVLHALTHRMRELAYAIDAVLARELLATARVSDAERRKTERAIAGLQRSLKALEGRVARFISDRSVTCVVCGEPLKAKRPDARYCSTKCRVRAHRARKATR